MKGFLENFKAVSDEEFETLKYEIFVHNIMNRKESIELSEYNKLLWFIFVVALNGLIALTISETKTKKLKLIMAVFFVLGLLGVSICWAYFGFWK